MKVGELLPQDDPDGEIGQRDPAGFAGEGDRAAGPRIHLEDVDMSFMNRILHVHQTHDAKCTGDGAGVSLDRLTGLGPNVLRRIDLGAVAGVNAALLELLHDDGDDVVTVTYRVHVQLGGALQEMVDQQGLVERSRSLQGGRRMVVLADVAFHILRRAGECHALT